MKKKEGRPVIKGEEEEGRAIKRMEVDELCVHM